MISLDNTYNEDELRNFDSRIKRILKSHSNPLLKEREKAEVSFSPQGEELR